jgi:hypothetical protein
MRETQIVAIINATISDVSCVLTDLTPAISPERQPAVRLLIASIVILLAGAVGLFAIVLGLGLLPLPYPLFVVRERLPLVFPLHMIASGLALILIPITAFLRHKPAIHRPIGRAAAASVIIGGAVSLPVACASEAAFAARVGLFVQGAVWLALLVAAITAIRRRDIARHAALMVMMAAVASGAIWLRLSISAALSVGLPFDPVYALASWACWLTPLALAVAWTFESLRPR